MTVISKESLRRLSLEELEGKLLQAKENFKAAAINLSEARQQQILKTKTIKGKVSKRKQELISQILQIQKATKKLNSQIEKIATGKDSKFEALKWSASKKIKQRKQELKEYGAYRTVITNEEKVLAWCEDMDISRETLEKLLEIYTMDDLAALSGDDFYDAAREALFKSSEQDFETFEPGEEEGGLTDLGIEDLGD